MFKPYGRAQAEDIREDEIIVRVHDLDGRVFDKGWKATVGNAWAIARTMEHGDLPYYCSRISKVEVIKGTKKIELTLEEN